MCVLIYKLIQGFPGGASGKEPACQYVRNMNSVPGPGRSPRGRAWQPTPVFLPGKSRGQRSLMGYSPQSHKEPDIAEAT